MSSANTIAPPDTRTASMMEKAVCVDVTLQAIGNSRKVPTSQVTVAADADMIKVSKTLLDAQELVAIRQLDGEIRQYLYSRASMPGFFKPGVYLVGLNLFEEVDAKLAEFKKQRQLRIDALVRVYPKLMEEAQRKLRDLFNPREYPSETELRASFRMSWGWTEFGVPGKLQRVRADLYAREKEKAERNMARAEEKVTQLLRANMGELVNHLVDRLNGAEDGKKKVFRNSMLDNIRDFLQTFRARNITDDAELEKLVERADQILAGVDSAMLRDADDIRAQVRQGFEQIKAKLEPMMEEAPDRMITFED